ncbi:hypothetical protein [Coleofasciculus sp. FACHB-T130]|uniref:hypothetical protein n=1 Tax=Coleofasciculus sp. FACHB-T130 TaxID=2692792 RepID=UPI00168537AC|nr:hypothetical protein [Coleofasciculus sp. FACHB-T130]
MLCLRRLVCSALSAAIASAVCAACCSGCDRSTGHGKFTPSAIIPNRVLEQWTRSP